MCLNFFRSETFGFVSKCNFIWPRIEQKRRKIMCAYIEATSRQFNQNDNITWNGSSCVQLTTHDTFHFTMLHKFIQINFFSCCCCCWCSPWLMSIAVYNFMSHNRFLPAIYALDSFHYWNWLDFFFCCGAVCMCVSKPNHNYQWRGGVQKLNQPNAVLTLVISCGFTSFLFFFFFGKFSMLLAYFYYNQRSFDIQIENVQVEQTSIISPRNQNNNRNGQFRRKWVENDGKNETFFFCWRICSFYRQIYWTKC